MSNRLASVPVALLAVLLGAAGSFVLTTVAMDRLPDSVLVGSSCAVALGIVLAWQGVAGFTDPRRADRTTLGLAAAGGALAFWAAPLLVLSQRATDAPSGADSLFLTTSVWALICVAAAFAQRSERPPVTALAGAVAAVAGAAGLLASWESPSSFSPFAKFPVREALMLVAGVLFAAGALALAAAARRAGARIAVAAGLAGAALLGVLVALPSLPTVGEIGRGALLPCVYLGIAVALLAAGWTRASGAQGVSRTTAPLLAVPLAVMALSAVERVTTVYGPNPIEWRGALAGGAVIVAGAVVLRLAEKPSTSEPSSPRRPFRLPLGLALASGALALASLATPALNAVAEGGTGHSFRAAWTMLGAESAAGWLVVAAAGLALAAVIEAGLGRHTRAWLPAAVSVVVCGLASFPLLGVTLHTWNRWVPAEVQQAYGTEYSRLVIEPRLDVVRVAALLLAVCAVAALGVSVVARNGRAKAAFEEDSR